MIRALTILVIAVLVGLVSYWFLLNPGTVKVTWMGYEMGFSVFVFVGASVLLLIALFVPFKIIVWIFRFPFRISQNRKEKQRQRGTQELIKLAESVEAENAPEALKHQKKASKTMSDDAFFNWFTARAYGLSENHLEENKAYGKLMKDVPFLALKGEAEAAMKRGDRQSTLEFLMKAQEIQPHSPWVLRHLLTLYRDSMKYKQAEEVINTLEDLMYLSKDEAKTELASLYDLMACDSKIPAQDQDEALRKAHYLDPSLEHVTQKFAKNLMKQGHSSYALSALEATWKESPSAEIGDEYIKLQKPETPIKAFEHAKKLVADSADQPESQLLLAKYALKAKLWGEARKILLKLEKKKPSPKVYKLLSELEMKEHKNVKDAYGWASKGCDIS